MKLFEINQTNDLEEAMWWVQRWVSGSMNDPEWDTSWLTKIKDVKSAFLEVRNIVGNKYSVDKLLWRYLKLSKKDANKMMKTEQLIPFNNHHSPFQSFTTERSVALNLPSELSIYMGNTHVLVSAQIPTNLIMFGMKDLMMSKNEVVKEYLHALGDWYYQEEVLVYMPNVLPLQSVEII